MIFRIVAPWWKHFRENPMEWEIVLLFLLGVLVLLFTMNWIAYTT